MEPHPLLNAQPRPVAVLFRPSDHTISGQHENALVFIQVDKLHSGRSQRSIELAGQLLDAIQQWLGTLSKRTEQERRPSRHVPRFLATASGKNRLPPHSRL